MSFEARQYRWLRFVVLAFGAVVIGCLTVLSAMQIHAIWPYARPMILDCGCQPLQLNLGSGPWIVTGLVTLTVVVLWARLVFAAVRSMLHVSRWRRRWRPTSRLVQHQQLARPYRLYDGRRPEAMTIGYIVPQIYVSQAMVDRLSVRELAAVLRHEQAHCRRLDPLWALVLESIGFAFGWPAGLRAWVSASYSYREISADAEATGNYRSTDDISGAILKLVTAGDVAAGPAFSPNGDRVEKLIDPDWRPRHRLWRVRDGLAIGTLALGLFFLTRVTVTTAAELPRIPVGICHQQVLLCAGTSTGSAGRTVCLEQHGWQCFGPRGSFPISLYDAVEIQQ